MEWAASASAAIQSGGEFMRRTCSGGCHAVVWTLNRVQTASIDVWYLRLFRGQAKERIFNSPTAVASSVGPSPKEGHKGASTHAPQAGQIGRASCRERV